MLCFWLTSLSTGALLAANPLNDLQQVLPAKAGDIDTSLPSDVAAAAGAVEDWVASQTWGSERAPDVVLADVRRLLATQQQVDRMLDELFALRTQFAEMPGNDQRRQSLRSYLAATTEMIGLSGRIRYLLHDAIDQASYDLDPHPPQFQQLLALLIESRSRVGAAVMSYVLFDPPPGSPAVPYPDGVRQQAIELIAVSENSGVLPQLVQFLKQPSSSEALVLDAAQAIRQIGLPQDPLPNQDPNLPAPAITAAELEQRLAAVDPARLSTGEQAERQELLGWLRERIEKGVTGDTFRIGGIEVHSGDWLLMRNPSPYNLFTDLSPGLFTHVGIVAVEHDSQGRRHFVIVDLPEQGDRIPATNVDMYLQRTLHYLFLRHHDPEVRAKLGETASRVIGNPSHFDLLFRSERVQALKGQPLEGTPIHTYCAGLLLLCAQETTLDRESFFPIAESPAGGNCLDNLGRLGLSIGDDFVSPTGAIFSSQLEVVGRREAMYEPGREIREAIYDHFARSMIEKELRPSPDAYQALREKVASLSKYNPWLARLLASANQVSEEMDLEAAAKAAAVVETLDEIAEGQEAAFVQARQSLMAGPMEYLTETLTAEQRAQIEQDRQRHAELFQQWSSGALSPRDLRVALVRYYTEIGRRQLDERFFPEEL